MKTKKIITKILVALALTFMIPQLVFLYMWEDLSHRSTFLLFGSTLMLIGIGTYLIWDIVQSIRSIFRNIDEIAKNDLNTTVPPSSDELELMGNSIEKISEKIVENMEELQRSTALIEKTKKDLRDTVIYMESIMNSMGDALIAIDSEYKIKRTNPAAKNLLKFEENSLIGRSVDVIFESLDENAFFKEEGVSGKRMVCITMESEKIPVDVNIQPIIDLIGDRIGHVLVIRDMRVPLALISRLKEANTSLEATAKERTQALEAQCKELKTKDIQTTPREKMASIGILTTGIAREVNGPLESVGHNLSLLQKYVHDITSYTRLLEYGLSNLIKEDDPERRNEKWDEIKQVHSDMKLNVLISNAEQIIQVSQDNLDSVKQISTDIEIYCGHHENKSTGIDLNKEIQNTLNVLEEDLKDKAEVVTRFEFLPPLTCYPQQLKQVFTHLFINAAHATKAGDFIKIRTFYKDALIHIIIQDTGTGIAPEHLENIFDPFFTTKGPETGRGLGLFISYGIVEKHGGTLAVESVVGEGTTFTMQLPVAQTEMFVHPALTIPAPH